MGNDISHRRFWCRRFRRFERLPPEEKTDVPDVPPAQGGRFWGSVNPPEEEKPQGAAAGLHGEEQGRKREKKEMASCSPPVAQGMGRSSELQQPGDNPPGTNPAGKTPAPTRGRAGGHTEVTTRECPVQPAVEVGAAGPQPRQGTAGSSSGSRHRGSTRAYRARQCKICRWLENLKAPEGNPKAKPGAGSSHE